MKALQATSVLLALVPFVASCDGDVKASDVVANGKAAVGKMADDLGNLSVDELKAKVSNVSKDLSQKLSQSFDEIKDKASALDVKQAVEPMVEQLSKLEAMLGEKMPSMESLRGALEELKTKFAGKEDIMEVLRPLIDKLQALLR